MTSAGMVSSGNARRISVWIGGFEIETCPDAGFGGRPPAKGFVVLRLIEETSNSTRSVAAGCADSCARTVPTTRAATAHDTSAVFIDPRLQSPITNHNSQFANALHDSSSFPSAVRSGR